MYFQDICYDDCVDSSSVALLSSSFENLNQSPEVIRQSTNKCKPLDYAEWSRSKGKLSGPK